MSEERTKLIPTPGYRRCGACGAKFAKAKDLADHLKVCDLANLGAGMLEDVLNGKSPAKRVEDHFFNDNSGVRCHSDMRTNKD